MHETMMDTRVTYSLELDGKFFLVENVPARLCQETGEQFFAPETVEHIHAILTSQRPPAKTIETPVYEYV
jgi:YgiT-type zinc finger domain-containing protein